MFFSILLSSDEVPQVFKKVNKHRMSEARVKYFPISKSILSFDNGIPVKVNERQASGSKFGETVYKSVTVWEDRIKTIYADKLDYLCFGPKGLRSLAEKMGKRIVNTGYPFKYLLEAANTASKRSQDTSSVTN